MPRSGAPKLRTRPCAGEIQYLDCLEHRGTLIGWLLLAVLLAVHASAGQNSAPKPRYPQEDAGADSLPARKKAQLATVSQFKVFYQFHFADKLKDSGITFVYHAVDDVTKHMRMGHYDHGSAVAVADVDGDGLYDIYFANQVGGNQLWKNLGNGKFKDITQEAGVGLPGRISVAAAFADIDNDGDQDLFVTTVRGGNVLFENDGHGHFKDITQEAGVGLVAHSSGAFFFDYDNDGLLDLLVCNVGKYTTDEKGPDGEYVAIPNAFSGHLYPDRYEYPVLYKNMGHNHFKDVTAEVGLKPQGWCGEAAFADVNNDGWPDIFFLNMQGHSHYYENEGGKKFVDKTSQYFPKTPWGAMGIKFFDFDNDGRMDLFIDDMHSDMSEEAEPENEKLKSTITWTDSYIQGSKSDYIWGNALYHNLGDGKFEEVSDRTGRRDLLALGDERGRRQCRWLGRHFHCLRYELSVSLRNQLDAAQQPRGEIPGFGVLAGDRASQEPLHSLVRNRLLRHQGKRSSGKAG